MNTLTGAEYFTHLLADCTQSDHSLWTEDGRITWSLFLQALQCFCIRYRWELVYESEDDLSCAIFAREALSTNQLPLLPEGERADERHPPDQ